MENADSIYWRSLGEIQDKTRRIRWCDCIKNYSLDDEYIPRCDTFFKFENDEFTVLKRL